MRGYLAIAFSILVWGITFVNTKALLTDFSSFEIQILRFGLAWLALCLASPKTLFAKCIKRDEIQFALMGFCGVLIYQFLENCAIYYTNASNVAILMSLGPIVTALLSRIFCRGRRNANCNMWFGSAIAVIGVMLVGSCGLADFEFRPIGDVMAIGAMVSWGIYSVLVDKVNSKGYAQIVVIRKTFGWALLFMLPIAAIGGAADSARIILEGSFTVTLDPAANLVRFSRVSNWFNLGVLGIFASALCFIAWNVACKSFGVISANVALYFTPIVGVVFAAVFLGERISSSCAFGGVLVLCGVTFTNIDFNRKIFRSNNLKFGIIQGGKIKRIGMS